MNFFPNSTDVIQKKSATGPLYRGYRQAGVQIGPWFLKKSGFFFWTGVWGLRFESRMAAVFQILWSVWVYRDFEGWICLSVYFGKGYDRYRHFPKTHESQKQRIFGTYKTSDVCFRPAVVLNVILSPSNLGCYRSGKIRSRFLEFRRNFPER